MNRAQRRKMGYKTATPGVDSPLVAQIGTKDGDIYVEFPEKIKWFSMGIAEARGFILELENKIKILEGEKDA